MAGIPYPLPQILQPGCWVGCPPAEALPDTTQLSGYPAFALLATPGSTLPPRPPPNLHSSGLCPLWTLPDAFASGYSLPFINNKLSPSLYLGTDMLFLFISVFFFHSVCIYHFMHTSTHKYI